MTLENTHKDMESVVMQTVNEVPPYKLRLYVDWEPAYRAIKAWLILY